MADVTITDQQKLPLTAVAKDANGIVVTDTFEWRFDMALSTTDATFSDADADPTFVVSGGPFNVGETRTVGAYASDGTVNSPTFVIDITGTLPLPAATIEVTAGEPEPK